MQVILTVDYALKAVFLHPNAFPASKVLTCYTHSAEMPAMTISSEDAAVENSLDVISLTKVTRLDVYRLINSLQPNSNDSILSHTRRRSSIGLRNLDTSVKR